MEDESDMSFGDKTERTGEEHVKTRTKTRGMQKLEHKSGVNLVKRYCRRSVIGSGLSGTRVSAWVVT